MMQSAPQDRYWAFRANTDVVLGNGTFIVQRAGSTRFSVFIQGRRMRTQVESPGEAYMPVSAKRALTLIPEELGGNPKPTIHAKATSHRRLSAAVKRSGNPDAG